jgi:hypothetical protein
MIVIWNLFFELRWENGSEELPMNHFSRLGWAQRPNEFAGMYPDSLRSESHCGKNGKDEAFSIDSLHS